ncbi:hypothetical protein VTO73DRAFT_3707 [Trametes versicolor]
MVRDGTWAFILSLVILVLNLVVYNVFLKTLPGVAYFWATSILSFIGSHVLLNLRQIALDPGLSCEDTSNTLPTLCLGHIDTTPSDETIVP